MSDRTVKIQVVHGIPPLPFKPLHKILQQYVYANKLPLRMTRWEEVVRAFYHYNEVARIMN